MNYRKCFFMTIVVVLSAMTIGTCFSVAGNNGTPNLQMRKEINLTIEGSGPQEEWNVTFGGVRWDISTSVKPIVGGGYILTGTKDALGYNNGGDCWLVKTDSDGNLDWERTYGGSECDAAEDVWQTSDGGFVLVGITKSFGAGNFDIWLIKTDGTGNELWNRTFGGREMEYGTSVRQTIDGGYIIGGFTGSYGMGGNDAWLVKVDTNGDFEWNKTFGDAIPGGQFSGEYFMCVQQTLDGGYIAAGRNYLDETGNSDMFVVKVDSSGNQQWEKLLGSAYPDGCLWITQTGDGGYILTGQSSQARSQPEDISLFKLDTNGNEEWRKYYAGPYFDTGTTVEQTKDSGYLITGEVSVDADETMDAILLKTDNKGNEEWRVTYGGAESDSCLEGHHTENGGYIAAGFTNSYGEGGQDAWLVKFGAFENQRPNTPSKASGPSTGKINQEYTFTTSTTDPDGDQLYYMFDFGDGTSSFWYGPYNSSEECTASHIWFEKGDYQVKVKAQDTNGAESEWSDPLPITMPYSYQTSVFLWEKLFERFPTLFQMLRQLQGFSSMINGNCFSENELIGVIDPLTNKEIHDNTGLLFNFFIPNDPLFTQQWALQNTGQTGGILDVDIDAPEAWDIETGNAEVVIAIIDSGIDLTHPDLVDNIWMNLDEIPDNGIDDDENEYVDDYQGYDFTFEDNNPYPLDHNGHGTVMSGVIAAMTDNEIGISGIAWNCKIMPVKVVDANWTSRGDNIFDGIRYAADNGAKVICMAFAYPNSVSKLKDAVNYAHDKGALLVCAAGNFDNNRKNYPAAYDNVIAVAGTDHSDHRMEALYDFNGVWVNSSYGDWVDIAAPGENIFTTSPTYHVTGCDEWGYELNYDILSGTTLAAPVVAGVAGLVFSKNPEYSPDKVAAILKANSDPYDSPYYLGMGRINAYKALMELNAEPEKPAVLEGTTSGKVGNHYNYTVSTVDVEGDQLYYLFDWGDGNTSGWLGPYDSNQLCTASYNWTEKGTYEIKAKAKDIFGLESEWSDPLPITMPYSYYKPLSQFLDSLF